MALRRDRDSLTGRHETAILALGKLQERMRVVLERDPETGEWAVWCPELPGCTSAGETQEEALKNIREAIELYLEPSPLELAPGAIARGVAL